MGTQRLSCARATAPRGEAPRPRRIRSFPSSRRPPLDPKELLQLQVQRARQIECQPDRGNKPSLLDRDDGLASDANPLGQRLLSQLSPMPVVSQLVLEPGRRCHVKFALHHTFPLGFVNIDGMSVT